MSRAVGVDLGGSNCRAGLVDVEAGRIVAEAKEPVADHRPEAVAALVAALCRRVDPSGSRVGVGVGFAGMLRGVDGFVINAPNFGWRDVDLGAPLRQGLGPAVAVHNDLNAIAVGEQRYGAGRGVADILCVYLGTGIGGGLVLDGRLYVGATHLAGEIGHTKVVPGGRLCGCGQRGCVEAYASGRNLALRAKEDLGGPAPRATSAAATLAGGVAHVHAGHLDEAARAGDAYASALWDEVAPLLGMTLANAVTLLNPARLILGGGVWEGAPELGRRATAVFRDLVNAPSGAAVTLHPTELGATAGMLGAAALVAEERQRSS